MGFVYFCLAFCVCMLIYYAVVAIKRNFYDGTYYGNSKRTEEKYRLYSVSFSKTDCVTKISFEKTFAYRTVERYIQRNYIKSPVLSDWKVKSTLITRQICIFPEDLPLLRNNSDDLIRRFADEISNVLKQNQNFMSSSRSDLQNLREIKRKSDYNYQLNNKIHEFWHKALEEAIQMAQEKDFERLREFIHNIWNTRDKVESAEDLHGFLNCVLNNVYCWKEHDEYAFQLSLEICELDLSNFDNICNIYDFSDYLLNSAVKKTILLEKMGLIEDAIIFCDFCIDKKLRDISNPTFEKRKERLLRKLEKVNGKNEKKS